MTKEAVLAFITENPYTGSANQIIHLSIGIHQASLELDRNSFRELKEESGIGDKIFSKLKVIGKTMSDLNKEQIDEASRFLPDSYSTIHVLSSLTAKELITGIKKKSFDRNISIRTAKEYVKQIKFPRLAGKIIENKLKDNVFLISMPSDRKLTEEQTKSFKLSLELICSQYGAALEETNSGTTTSLKQKDRAEREVFWRGVLEKEISIEWFEQTNDDIKKQFNIKSIEELRTGPLRSFTGFLMCAGGGREVFWDKFARGYIAKLNLEQEVTGNRTQRYNIKRRLDEVLEKRTELAVWNNAMLKSSGFLLR